MEAKMNKRVMFFGDITNTIFQQTFIPFLGKNG